MGLFSRLGDIINSNINAMLDSAENPEKIARLIIQEMEDTLVEVRTAAARAMADKKEMEREIVHFTQTRDEWAAKAELAIDKGREDLARGALTAKQKADGEIERRKLAMDAAEEAFEKRQDDLAKLQAKLDEAKAKHRALMMRREAAEQRIRIRSQVYDGKAISSARSTKWKPMLTRSRAVNRPSKPNSPRWSVTRASRRNSKP